MMNARTAGAIFGIVLAVSARAAAASDTVLSGDGQETILVIEEESGESKADKAWLGIYFETVTRRDAGKAGYERETGIVVSMVIPESPAERGGLKEGDIIFSFDGVVVEDADHFGTIVKARRPGDEIVLTCYRKGVEKKIEVRLGGQTDRSLHLQELGRSGEEALKSFEKALVSGKGHSLHLYLMRGRIGVLLHDLDGDLGGYFGVGKDGGALVIEVEPGSPAEEAGVKSGDVIVAVDGDPVGDVSAATEAISSIEPGDTVAVDVLRKGARKSLAVALDPGCGNAPFRVLPPGGGTLDSEALERLYRLRKDDPEKLRGELDKLKEQMRELEERLKTRETK